MKIVHTESCTCFGCNIEDKGINSFSDKEIKDIAYMLFNKLDRSELKNFIIEYTRNHGESQYKYTCYDCGNSVYTYTLNV